MLRKHLLLAFFNLYPDTKSVSYDNDKTYSGDYLMNVGIDVSATTQLTSVVFEIEEVTTK